MHLSLECVHRAQELFFATVALLESHCSIVVVHVGCRTHGFHVKVLEGVVEATVLAFNLICFILNLFNQVVGSVALFVYLVKHGVYVAGVEPVLKEDLILVVIPLPCIEFRHLL